MTGPRDWDKEMAEIDRLIAKQPAQVPAPVGAGKGAPAQRGAPAAPPAARGGSTLGVWLRVLLAAALAAGMTQWPYAHACGLPLLVYTGAAGMVVLAGLWSAVGTWRSRLGLAHVVSLVVMGWGLALMASVILPRVGYADPALTWLCR